MPTAVIILLVLNILLNLVFGFLVFIALGELGALEKFRFEFEPVTPPDNAESVGDAMRKAI